MGLFRTAYDILGFKGLLCYLSIVLITWTLFRRINEYRRIIGSGGYCLEVKSSRFPLGFDIIIACIIGTLQHQELTLWRDFLVRGNSSWTSEARLLGHRIIFTADPQNINALLATQFSDYGKGKPFHNQWKAFLGDSIFTTDGLQWHESRQMIKPYLSVGRISDLRCLEDHMQTVFRFINEESVKRSKSQDIGVPESCVDIVNISDLFSRFTLDVTTEFLLGDDVESLKTTNNDFATAFDTVQRLQNIYTRVGQLRYLLPHGRFWSSLKIIDRFVNQHIIRVLMLPTSDSSDPHSTSTKHTFLHELAKATRDPKALRDQVVAVLLAGRDTTAATLSWSIYELSKHPNCVAQLRAEVLSIIGELKAPTYTDLKKMTYLRAVLNETLRLYPPIPFNVRLALKDTTLPRGGGPDGTKAVAVLKDTPICYSPLLLHRRADLYPSASSTFADPASFSPERWDVWQPHSSNHIPFNAGLRTCVGQQFAITEMTYVLARFFQRFASLENRMDCKDQEETPLQSGIVLTSRRDILVSLTLGSSTAMAKAEA